MRLNNKVAIITGAASGIGKEIAMDFAKEGAKVAIADMNLAQANLVTEEIKSQGGQAMAVAMDVTPWTHPKYPSLMIFFIRLHGDATGPLPQENHSRPKMFR